MLTYQNIYIYIYIYIYCTLFSYIGRGKAVETILNMIILSAEIIKTAVLLFLNYCFGVQF